MTALAPYWKAVVGFIAPGAVVLTAATQDASAGGSVVTGAEWLVALCACIITGAGVYGVPNRDPHAQHQDESVQPPR